MNKLYIITGPAGVGKSTISKEIANSLSKSVLLEGDDFYHQVVGSYIPAWKDGNHLDVFWKICCDTMKTYLDNGYDVVFNYIISKDKFNELKDIFSNYEVKFIVLLVSEDTIMERDKLRDEDCRMNERCLILLNNFKEYNYDDNYILYTDNLSINDSVLEIMNNNRFIIEINN